MTAPTAEKAAPKRRGRPPLADNAQRSDKRPRSIRLGDAHWAKLQQLGTDWLERALDRAKLGDS